MMRGLILLEVGVLSLLTACQDSSDEVQEEPPLAAVVGKKAPDFQFQDMSNGAVSKLSELEGKAVVLDFWWSGCARSEPVMPELQKKIGEEKSRWADQVSFLAVGVDMTFEEGQEHVKNNGWSQSQHVWIEPKSNPAYQSYLAMPRRGTPATYIIGKDGVIQAVIQAKDYGTRAEPTLNFSSAWQSISEALDKADSLNRHADQNQ